MGAKHELAREVLSGSSVLISIVKRGLLVPALLVVVSESPRSFEVYEARFSGSSLLLASAL